MTMSAKHLLVALTILAATPAVPQAAQTDKKPAAVTLASQQRAEEDKQLLSLIALTAAPLLPPVMAQDHPPATPATKKPTVAQALRSMRMTGNASSNRTALAATMRRKASRLASPAPLCATCACALRSASMTRKSCSTSSTRKVPA